MPQNRSFSVATIGLSKIEQQMLTRIFWLSKSRRRGYALVDVEAGVSPDIVIVNADDAGAMARWRSMLSAQMPAPQLVMAYHQTPPDTDGTVLRCSPFLASRVLAVLDNLTVTGLGFIPELVIGGGDGQANDDQGALAELAEHTPLPSTGPACRVLVVDDSLAVRKQLELELRLCKTSVDFAESGERALDLLARHTYDIAFLDVVLPGIDGYQVCKALKKGRNKKSTIAVMLTSKASPFDRVRGKLSGCNAYLGKPLSHDDFRQAMTPFMEAVSERHTTGADEVPEAHPGVLLAG